MIDSKEEEREKGVDPLDHPRVKGLRWTRGLNDIPCYCHAIELYLVLVRIHRKVIVSTLPNNVSNEDNEASYL